jgi:hypothetical protein
MPISVFLSLGADFRGLPASRRNTSYDQLISPSCYANGVPTCAAIRSSIQNLAHMPAKCWRISALAGRSPEGENDFAIHDALAAKTAAIASINGPFIFANRGNIMEAMDRFRAQHSHALPGFQWA